MKGAAARRRRRETGVYALELLDRGVELVGVELLRRRNVCVDVAQRLVRHALQNRTGGKELARRTGAHHRWRGGENIGLDLRQLVKRHLVLKTHALHDAREPRADVREHERALGLVQQLAVADRVGEQRLVL
jgi:hypothetical protein